MCASFRHTWVVYTQCPVPQGLDPACSIPLPHETPLGRYEGQQYQPTGIWPVTFLCLRHGISALHSSQDVRLDVEPVSPEGDLPVFWTIEATCAHENCDKMHTIYTARMPAAPELVSRLMRTTPAIPCDGHDLVWREDLIRATAY